MTQPWIKSRALLIVSTARELSLLEFIRGYAHRWPVETNFFVGQDTAAMEMPRALDQVQGRL